MDYRTDYIDVVTGWREAGAGSVGDFFAESGQYYDAYTWYLIALALGDESAAGRLGLLDTVEVLCAEDTYLANLQVAIWFARGIHVHVDVRQALSHLRVALRHSPSNAALPTGLVDLRTLLTLIDSAVASHGWPPTLDFTQPLGPATAYGPFWLNERHVVGCGD